MKKFTLLPFTALALTPGVASAHCPLCTAGAGALAVLAASLGISTIIVGIFIGAFSLALGTWLAPMITKRLTRQFIPHQNVLLSLLIFLSTVIPIMPLVQDYGPLYISFIGEYGTTLTINYYLQGVTIGGVIMFASPFLSRWISKIRSKTIPYQGISLTLALLLIASAIVQILA